MEIREIKDDEIEVAFALHNRMNGASRTADQWRWEYRGLMPEKSVFCVIAEKGEIIGTQAMMPVYLDIGGKKVLTGKSENSLLDPRFRGGTHFVDLYEHCIGLCKERGMLMVWGFTPAVKVWRDKLHFDVYEDSLYYSKFVMDLNKQLRGTVGPDKKLVDRIRSTITTAVHYLYSRFKMGTHGAAVKDDAPAIEDGFRSKDDPLELQGSVRERFPDIVQIHKDGDFLRWRAISNPNLEYHIRCIYEGSRLRGYLMFSRKADFVSIADLMYDDPLIGERLVGDSLRTWRDEGIASISFFGSMEDGPTREKFRMLEGFGFIARKNDMAFVLRGIGHDDMDRIKDFRRWSFDFLWLEGYTS
jgi:hypothetical protein